MSTYSVRCAVARPGQASGPAAPAEVTFTTTDAVVSQDPAPPIEFDLAELVALESSDGELQLALHSGPMLRFSAMGKTSAELFAGLIQARRDRTALVFRFGRESGGRWEEGSVLAPNESSARRAGLRLFESLLGIIPDRGEPKAIAFGEIQAIRFEEAAYDIVVETRAGECRIGKLARRTAPFLEEFKRARLEFVARYQAQLKDVMPDLAAHRLQELSGDWAEGIALSGESLDERSPGTTARFLKFLPSDERKVFVNQLQARFTSTPHFGWYYSTEAAGDSARPFEPFALFQKSAPGGYASAWEVLGEMGTATYIFRGTDSDLAAKVNAALRSIRFAREPIYLARDELLTTGAHRQYVPLVERSEDVRFLRERFAGRALHVEPERYAARLAALCGEPA